MNIIVTAANSQYFESLLTLISSIHGTSFDVVDSIVVYDLGLDEEEISALNRLHNVETKQFPVSVSALHPKFLDGKSHVYKMFCLKDAANEENCSVLWLDAGVMLLQSAKEMFEKIEAEHIFCVMDSHLNRNFTHSECRRIMAATDEELNATQLSSGIFGYRANGKYCGMINQAYDFSMIPGCCDGDQENHRHDQSILSILVARYGCPSNSIERYGYWTDHRRNLQTAIETDAVVFVHRRGHYDKRNLRFKA